MMYNYNSTGVYYAFVAWISSLVGLIIFLLWALSPNDLLHGIGINYYPSRYYAIAIPAYSIVVVVLVVIGYIGINLLNTLDPEEMLTIRDDLARKSPGIFLKCNSSGGIPDVGDIDPVDVSNILFGNSGRTQHKFTAVVRTGSTSILRKS